MPIGQPPIKNRPDHGAATPMDAVVITLMGGQRHGGVMLTRHQLAALGKVYQFDMDYKGRKAKEALAAHVRRHECRVIDWDRKVEEYEAWFSKPKNTRGSRPQDPRRGPYGECDVKRPTLMPFDEASVAAFHASADNVNILKYAEHDGVRVMAFLARLLEPGEDPVQFIEGLCIEAGYDCPLSEWPDANEEKNEEL